MSQEHPPLKRREPPLTSPDNPVSWSTETVKTHTLSMQMTDDEAKHLLKVIISHNDKVAAGGTAVDPVVAAQNAKLENFMRKFQLLMYQNVGAKGA